MSRAWFYIYDAKHDWISYAQQMWMHIFKSYLKSRVHFSVTQLTSSQLTSYSVFFTQNYYMASKDLEYCTWIIWTTAIVLLCCSCYFWSSLNILPNILFCTHIYIYNLVHTGWVHDERIFIFGKTILLIMHSLCPFNVNLNTNKHTNSKDFSHISETQKVLG